MKQVRTAICDVIDCTSTEIAPWTLVAGGANDKYFARIKVLQILCQRWEAALS